MPSRVSARDRLRAWEAKHGGMCGSPRLHEPLRKTEEEGEEEEDLDWAGMQAAASGIHPRSPEVTMAIHDLAEECTDAMTFTVNRLDLDQEATVVGGPGTSNCEEEGDDGARVDPSEAMAESMIDVFIRGGYTVAEDRKVKLQPAPRAAFSMKEYEAIVVTLDAPVAVVTAHLYQTEVTGTVGLTVVGKRAEKILTSEDIARVLSPLAVCCKSKCLSNWKKELKPELSKAIVTTERRAYAAMGELSRQQHYSAVIRSLLRYKTGTANNGEGVVVTGFSMDPFKVKAKTPLCQKAYAKITGLSMRSLQRYTRLVKLERRSGQVGRRAGVESSKTEAARAWLRNYTNLCSDKMPNSTIKGHTEVHLDVSEKREAWYTYVAFMLRGGYSFPGEIMTYKGFLAMWAQDFPWVKTKRRKTIQSKCHVCEDLEALITAEKDPKRLGILRLLQYDHRLFQQAERQAYYSRRLLAQSHPELYTSLIVDGMQQATCEIPRKFKYEYPAEKMSQKLVGVLVHGNREQHVHVYRLFPHIKGSENANMTCLWRTIVSMIEHGLMPKDQKLFIQMDGGSENTNQTLIRFAAWLCQQRICRSVVLSRLPVGHTHEDIDQKFSVISRRLRSTDILTPREFEMVVRTAFNDVSRDSTTRVKCVFKDVLAVWDFKSWFADHGEDAWPVELEHWTKRESTVHQIRLSRDRVFIQTRRYSNAKAREVTTRDMSNSNAYSTDTKLPFPRLSAVLSVWEPDDSKHGGKLYLRHPIGGAPHYEDFTQTAGAWRAKLHEVKAGLEDQFRSSHIFTDHRIDDWQRFWGAYPWDGLGDLAAEDAPSFYVPAFPDAPTFVGDEEVEDLMRVAGEDKEGRPRLYFDKGMDMLTYPRGRSKTTYSGFHLDGTAHQKKRPAPAPDLSTGQFVLVSQDGLREAQELIKVVGSYDQVVAAGAGVWLARVDALVHKNGNITVTPPFAERVVKKQRVSSGKEPKRGSDKDKDKDKDQAPQVTSVRVSWYGYRTGVLAMPTCQLSLPIRDLDIQDVIPCSSLVFVEEYPGQIRVKADSRLYAFSVKKIQQYTPQASEPTPTATDASSQHNHAGVYIGANEPPTEAESSMWLASKGEVEGFEWKDDPSADDPDPPTYSVVGMRRSLGQLYAIVRSSHQDEQQDHSMQEIREKVFTSRVEHGIRRLPLMLQWRSFMGARLQLDHELIRSNAEYYQDVVSRKPPLRPEEALLSLSSSHKCKEFVTKADLQTMFEEDPHTRGFGQFIRHDSLAIGITLLRQRVRSSEDVRVCVGQWFHFSREFMYDYDDNAPADTKFGETRRARMLRLIMGLSGPRNQRSSMWLDSLHRRYDKVLLPYNLNSNHFVVFEIVFRSSRGRYIKVWDGMRSWGTRGGDVGRRQEIKIIQDVFFRGADLEIIAWEDGDPLQETGYGCGPFAFLTLSYLTLGHVPRGWTARDEAVARNFLWGCIMKGELLPLPQLKLL